MGGAARLDRGGAPSTPHLDLVHPDDRDEAAAFAERLAQGTAGAHAEIELRVRTRAEDHRRILFSAVAAPDEPAVYLSGKDVTARHAVEAALRASDQRYEAVTQATSDAIVSADADGRIIFWNAAPRACSAGARGRCSAATLEVLMPERYRAAHRAGMARFLATGESRVIGHDPRDRGRSGATAASSHRAVDRHVGAGRAPVFTGVVRDVSDRVTRACAAPGGEALHGGVRERRRGARARGARRRVLRANRALAELTRPLEPELLESRPRVARRTPTTAAPTPRRWPPARRADPPLATERRCVRRDGTVVHVRIHIVAVRDNDGEPLHFVAPLEDVTERRRMVEALRSRGPLPRAGRNLPDTVITLFDDDLRLLVVEGGGLARLGSHAGDLEGRLLSDVPPAGHVRRASAPHYRGRPARRAPRLRHRRPDGSVHLVGPDRCRCATRRAA